MVGAIIFFAVVGSEFLSNICDMSDAYKIEVNVLPEYLADQSEPDAGRYVFAYHISIRNTGRVPAQLLSRHWFITDEAEQIEEVMGEGVVGEQPLIAPGGEYQYSSFCILDTPVGTMHGNYQMIAEDGTLFKADIPTFMLAMPGKLN